jgi:hypothetical protein
VDNSLSITSSERSVGFTGIEEISRPVLVSSFGRLVSCSFGSIFWLSIDIDRIIPVLAEMFDRCPSDSTISTRNSDSFRGHISVID